MKIFLVEDNESLARRIKRQLRVDNLVDIVHTGTDALEMLAEFTYDIIIVDLKLPDIHGSVLCERIRSMQIDTPLLVMTGVDDVDVKVALLNIGADDYITKPFHAKELKARISALGRRYPSRTWDRNLTCGDLVLDPMARTVHRAGDSIKLRRKEFDILEYLLRNKGRVLTRQMIIDHAWESTKSGWGSTVDVHIKHLRDKIDRPFSYPLIKTAYGLGYRVDASGGINLEKGEQHA